MRPRTAVVAALASGLLLAASFPVPGWAVLGWVALVPLLVAIEGAHPASAFGIGWLAGFAFFLVSFDWVPGTIVRATGTSAALAGLPLLALSAALAVYVAVFSAGVARLSERLPGAETWMTPLLWASLEWLRSSWPLPCPWNLLGYSELSVLPLVQIADLTGIYGVGALIVAVNGALASAVLGRRGWRTRLGFALALSLAAYGYGTTRLTQVRAAAATHRVRVGIVQPAVDPNQKWDPARRESVVALQEELSREALGRGAELIVWPEASVPYVFAADEFYARDAARFAADRHLRDRMHSFVAAAGVPLLFGGPALVVHPFGRGEAWNSLNRSVLLLPNGGVAAVYDKMILVPFGEYVPWPRMLSFVDKLVPGVGSFVPGTRPTLFSLGDARFGVLICYEAIFPDFVRRFVDRGAELLVNQTNDAWFGDTGAPHQHLAMAVVRAIENRVPLVRVANTGVSAVVGPDGSIAARIPLGERAARVVEVRSGGSRPTLYTRYGDWFAKAAVLASVLVVLYAGWMKPKGVDTAHGIGR